MAGALHADASAVLAAWTPPNDEQADLRRRFLDHLTAYADGVWRSCHPDHLTASALILSADQRSVLLTLHRKLGRWLQTGGHCEASDATLVAAAYREGTEESGIGELSIDRVPVVLSRHPVPCGPLRPAHHLDVQYVAYAPEGARPRISAESSDLRWFRCDALPTETDDSVRELVHHATARRPA